MKGFDLLRLVRDGAEALNASEKFALLVLATYADNHGRCYPSKATLAANMGLQKRAAIRLTNALVRKGFLIPEANQRGGAPGSTVRYRISVERLTGVVGDTRTDALTGVVGDTDGCRGRYETGVVGDTQTTSELPMNCHRDSARDAHAPARDAPRSKSSEISGDFVPDQKAVCLAEKLGISLSDELPRFIDHYLANGKTMQDWHAAFRYWLRKAPDFAKQGLPGTTRDDRRLAAARAIYGDLGATRRQGKLAILDFDAATGKPLDEPPVPF